VFSPKVDSAPTSIPVWVEKANFIRLGKDVPPPVNRSATWRFVGSLVN